ncbi:MAG TPA: hypothetical protein DDX98_09115 [Bacteroidales bacterium]|jgi:hypothetical protein|nr:hypothetical protein [Bacteroidales bacterium]
MRFQKFYFPTTFIILFLSFSFAPAFANNSISSNDSVQTKTFPVFQRGYKGHFVMGYCFIPDESERSRLKFDVVNSFQANQHVSVGIGLGLRSFTDNSRISELLPIFFETSFTALNNSPLYFTFQIGTVTDTDDFMKYPGLFLTLGGGVTFNLSPQLMGNIGISYEHISLHQAYNDFSKMNRNYYNNNTSNMYTSGSSEIGALSISFGIIF